NLGYADSSSLPGSLAKSEELPGPLGAPREERMSDSTNTKLWGGRFTGEVDRGFAEFNQSFSFDRRLFEVDVRASIAHCDALAGAGALTKTESEQIKSALRTIMERARASSRYFEFE